MWIITKLNAPNDRNGNPRRGWYCQLPGTNVTYWVEGGGRGHFNLDRFKADEGVCFLSNGFWETVSLDVSVKEYKRLRSAAKVTF